ncbi:pyroglutamyl-peptidase I [Actinotalea sp. JY-7876]|uniref:pyroglutamyl-peptidase I n=1 Tax=Actinotalea sp. JY-7876 TaxID=2758442 RepID=UPI0015F4A6DE|nr:pyroglutamyl-peptidase I [Actinotalea sp. JY-7876]
MSRTVLLTGFEPFDGQVANASWDAVRAVAQGWDRDEQVVVARLPVSFRGARQRLRDAVREHAPDVVVLVGEAGGRSAVGVERVALNVIDARIPDNDGSAPVDVPVVAGGPTALLSGLPVKACLAAVRAAGVPAEVSNTAGTYVCNATFYALMHLLACSPGLPGVRGGLVHVPRDVAQVRPGEASLPVGQSAVALWAVLGACLDGSEITMAAGSEA